MSKLQIKELLKDLNKDRHFFFVEKLHFSLYLSLSFYLNTFLDVMISFETETATIGLIHRPCDVIRYFVKVKFAESKEDDQEEVKAGKKRKAQEDSYNDFTRDERKALDFYEVRIQSYSREIVVLLYK